MRSDFKVSAIMVKANFSLCHILTFKDLKKRVGVETTHQNKLIERLNNKPFWIWNIFGQECNWTMSRRILS
jgi:hypothetical protein